MSKQPPPASSSATLAEQIVELSAIAGGLAHEIRNPLSTLKVNLQLLDEDWRSIESPDGARPADPREVARRSRKRIATLLEESARLERILQDFLEYIGRRELKKSPADLRKIVEDLAVFYRPQASASNIDLGVQLPQHPVVCNVDTHVLKQALLNLLINAQQALLQGGNITMRVAQENGEARLEIEDSGPGIALDVQHRIFEAYYSTKPGGSGLGLAVTRQIVREHGGRIAIESQPGQGSRFIISLPMVSPS